MLVEVSRKPVLKGYWNDGASQLLCFAFGAFSSGFLSTLTTDVKTTPLHTQCPYLRDTAVGESARYTPSGLRLICASFLEIGTLQYFDGKAKSQQKRTFRVFIKKRYNTWSISCHGPVWIKARHTLTTDSFVRELMWEQQLQQQKTTTPSHQVKMKRQEPRDDWPTSHRKYVSTSSVTASVLGTYLCCQLSLVCSVLCTLRDTPIFFFVLFFVSFLFHCHACHPTINVQHEWAWKLITQNIREGREPRT